MTLIEDLLDLQTPNVVRISPNSQQVLYSTTLFFGAKKGEHATSTLWLAETGHAGSSKQVTSGLYCDQTPRWSPDGASIAFTSDRAKQGEQWAIYLLPTKFGGEAYPVTAAENERTIDRLEFSPDGNFIAYTSADEKTPEKKAKEKDKDDAKVWGEDWPHSRLRLVHVATKQVTILTPNDAHVMEFCWNYDGSRIAVAQVPNPDLDSAFIDGTTISIIDVASKKISQVCVFPSAIKDLTWAEDDTVHFIGFSNPESVVSAQMVYSIDLKAAKTQYAKHAHGEEDCAWELRTAGKDVTIFVQNGVEDEIRMLGGQVMFSKNKEIMAWDAAFTKDSDEMIIAVAQSATSSPAAVYTVTASGGAMVRLSNHGKPVEGQHFGTANFLRCRSDDDEVDLDALYITPRKGSDKPTKPLPTIVFPHGGPYRRINDTFNPSYFMWTTLLVNAGYGALFPNYRGSSGRGEKFAAYVKGNVGTGDYDDVITLTDLAITEGYADKSNLLVAGWSQGGFLSFLAAVRNGMHGKGWRFKAAIPGAGVTDSDTLSLTSDAGVFEGDLAGNCPWQCDKSDVSGRSGSALWEFKKAAEARAIPPVLILHAEQDLRVPLEQAVGFRRALVSAKLPYEMVVYPREGHIIKERKHLVDMAERVLRFVDMHIGSGKS